MTAYYRGFIPHETSPVHRIWQCPFCNCRITVSRRGRNARAAISELIGLANQHFDAAHPVACAYCQGRHRTTAERDACATHYYATAPVHPNPEDQ